VLVKEPSSSAQTLVMTDESGCEMAKIELAANEKQYLVSASFQVVDLHKSVTF